MRYPRDLAEDGTLPNDTNEKQRPLKEQGTLQPPPKTLSAHEGSVSEHAAPVIAPESDDGGFVFVLMSLTALTILLWANNDLRKSKPRSNL